MLQSSIATGATQAAIVRMIASEAKPWSVSTVKVIVTAIAFPDIVPGTPPTSQYLWRSEHWTTPRLRNQPNKKLLEEPSHKRELNIWTVVQQQ